MKKLSIFIFYHFSSAKIHKDVIMWAGILLLYTGIVSAAERPKAEISCAPTAQQFVYDCAITLRGKKSDTPVAGAKLLVGADMPSMPMAHNVRPAQAQESDQSGVYNARIELEMYGEWALKIEVSAPTRDKIIQKKHFGKNEVNDIE